MSGYLYLLPLSLGLGLIGLACLKRVEGVTGLSLFALLDVYT